MSNERTIRAWKDADYRRRLSAADRARLEVSPVGPVELSDEELGEVAGGTLIHVILWTSYLTGCRTNELICY